MSTVYEADITITMRGVSDPVGLPYTVNPFEMVDGEALIEIREGATGTQGPRGDSAWPWAWQGDSADFATLQALGLGTADARQAWRVVADNAVYLWTGLDWVRFDDAFLSPGRQGATNALSGVGVVGEVESDAAAEVIGTSPNQTLSITFPRGEIGEEGDPGVAGAISDAEDVGDLTGARQDSVLSWAATPGEFQPIPAPLLGGPWAIASNQFTGGSNMASGSKTLATMNVQSQPYAWRPLVMSGSLTVQIHTPAGDETTQVAIEVHLGSIDGDLIGFGYGVSAASLAQVMISPHYQAPLTPDSTIGVVQANQTATLYILARRTAGTRNYSIVTAGAQLVIMAQPLRIQP